jgi:hypothetical protein
MSSMEGKFSSDKEFVPQAKEIKLSANQDRTEENSEAANQGFEQRSVADLGQLRGCALHYVSIPSASEIRQQDTPLWVCRFRLPRTPRLPL